jgi:hypothetical protein
MGSNTFLGDNMIHTDEDDEFDRIERENAMKGQPYHWDVYVSPSQRNQVLEEAAKLCENSVEYAGDELAKQIRGLKT